MAQQKAKKQQKIKKNNNVFLELNEEEFIDFMELDDLEDYTKDFNDKQK